MYHLRQLFNIKHRHNYKVCSPLDVIVLDGAYFNIYIEIGMRYQCCLMVLSKLKTCFFFVEILMTIC